MKLYIYNNIYAEIFFVLVKHFNIVKYSTIIFLDHVDS